MLPLKKMAKARRTLADQVQLLHHAALPHRTQERSRILLGQRLRELGGAGAVLLRTDGLKMSPIRLSQIFPR